MTYAPLTSIFLLPIVTVVLPDDKASPLAVSIIFMSEIPAEELLLADADDSEEDELSAAEEDPSAAETELSVLLSDLPPSDFLCFVLLCIDELADGSAAVSVPKDESEQAVNESIDNAKTNAAILILLFIRPPPLMF
jgi:hypothetical protein